MHAALGAAVDRIGCLVCQPGPDATLQSHHDAEHSYQSTGMSAVMLMCRSHHAVRCESTANSGARQMGCRGKRPASRARTLNTLESVEVLLSMTPDLYCALGLYMGGNTRPGSAIKLHSLQKEAMLSVRPFLSSFGDSVRLSSLHTPALEPDNCESEQMHVPVSGSV